MGLRRAQGLGAFGDTCYRLCGGLWTEQGVEKEGPFPAGLKSLFPSEDDREQGMGVHGWGITNIFAFDRTHSGVEKPLEARRGEGRAGRT